MRGAERHRGELPTVLGQTYAPEQRCEAPSAISLEPVWGLQPGVGRDPPRLKRCFKQYLTLFQLFLDELWESKKEWGCRRSSQRICQHLGHNLACRFKTSFYKA